MSLLVISPAGSMKLADIMKRSGERHGLEVHVYVGPLYSPHGKTIQAFQPIEMMKNKFTQTHILSADAPDVLFLAGEDEIMEKFKSFGKGMVVSGENYGLRMPNLDKKLTEMVPPGHHPFANIGLWMGERHYAIECLQKSIDIYDSDATGRAYAPDGGCGLDGPGAWFSYARYEGTIDYALDHASVMFQSMGGPHTEVYAVVKDGRIYNTHTGTWPIAIHYNGGGKTINPQEVLAKELYGYER